MEFEVFQAQPKLIDMNNAARSAPFVGNQRYRCCNGFRIRPNRSRKSEIWRPPNTHAACQRHNERDANGNLLDMNFRNLLLTANYTDIADGVVAAVPSRNLVYAREDTRLYILSA